jgi:hypothetical protein
MKHEASNQSTIVQYADCHIVTANGVLKLAAHPGGKLCITVTQQRLQ